MSERRPGTTILTAVAVVAVLLASNFGAGVGTTDLRAASPIVATAGGAVDGDVTLVSGDSLGRADLGGGTSSARDALLAWGAARITSSAGSTRSAYLKSVYETDVDVVARLGFQATPTGGGAYVSLVGRQSREGTNYRLTLRHLPDGKVVASATRVIDGVATVLDAHDVPGVTFRAGDQLQARLHITGTTTTTVRGKVWRAGSAEPSGWLVQGSESTPSQLRGKGYAGAQLYLSRSWTAGPATVEVDELQVRRASADGAAGPVPTTVPDPKPGNSTPPTTAPSKPSPGGFVHPGVVLDREQLDYVKARLDSGQQPWTSALNQIYNSGGSSRTDRRPTSYRYSSLSYVPAPVAVVQAPGASSARYLAAHPELGYRNIGDVEHLDDARAAYTHALLWYYTGDRAHAAKAIEIMNAWSSTLTEIKFDQPRRPDNGGHIFDNGKLQAGWAGSLFSRSAEIIRYSNAGWSTRDIERFGTMLRNVYLPLVITGWSSGANWLMTFAEATMGIGVFLEDRAAFDAGVRMWREKTPTTIYLPSDGPLPVAPTSWYATPARMKALWHNPGRYVEGLQGETLRDLSHMTMGLGAMSNAAETAHIQGVDLFGSEKTRIVAGFELNAGYVNEYLDEVARRGGTPPPTTWRPRNWVGDSFDLSGTAYLSGWEVALNHYSQRGVSMPNTKRLAERLRPRASAALHLSWDSLTHVR